jgi:hypothetical protein
MTYLTAAGTYNIAVQPYGIYVEVNTGFTGTITIADVRGTQAVITNPTTQSNYRYYGFQGAVTAVVAGAGNDTTISILNHGQ